MNNHGKCLAGLLHPWALLLLAGACGQSARPASLVSIALSPATLSIPAGRSAQVVATGTYDDGSARDVTQEASWSVVPGDAASISPSGRFQAGAPGLVVIQATVPVQVNGKVAGSVEAALHVQVTAAVLDSILVHAASATVAKGLSVQLTAEGRYSDRTSATLAAPVWSSSDPAVVTVDPTGLAFGAGIGTAWITATDASTTSGRASLVVTPPLLVAAVLQPASATSWRGHPVRFGALGTYTDGSNADATNEVLWSVSDPQVAALDAPGRVRGLAGGSVQIAASWTGGVAAPVALQVLPQRLAFETSAQGPGNMSSWPASGGRYGLVGADAICQSLATGAGLPGTYRAWLSDSRDDAYCRINGLSGTKGNKCGQAILPTGAGPWIRTDGQPFAPRIDAVAAGRIYTPLRFDEAGRELAPGSFRFAATDPDGTHGLGATDPYELGTCSDWSVGSGAIWLGAVDDTTELWTHYEGSDCQLPASLACLEVAAGSGADLAFPSPPPSAKQVFVGSGGGTGNLHSWALAGGATGIAAGDAICQGLAALGGLANAGRFKAFLSDSTIDAIDRLTSGGPWVRGDGVVVAEDKARLASGRLLAPINVTERLEYLGNQDVWTGSTAAGRRASDTCNDWKADSVYYGMEGLAAGTWTDWLLDQPHAAPVDCRAGFLLYCFED